MMKNWSALLFLLCLSFLSCKTSQIEGLWVVEEVKVGEEKMTPQARWMRFNADKSQESGNGWTQHSVGTWELDKTNNTLKVINTNGYIDPAEPFKVTLDKNSMSWQRKEEGRNVEVNLKRIEKLPSRPADHLMGVWKLTLAKKNKQDITAELDPSEKRYLFLRWDKSFTIQHTPDGRLAGIYRSHGHRNNVELIYYGSNERKTWQFEVSPDKLVLRSNADGEQLEREYKRIDYFPE